MYASIAILTSRGALAQTYTYELSEPGTPVGACVLVPFQNQVLLGYVTELLETADVPNTRTVLGRFAAGDVTEARVDLAAWMSQRWLCPVASCLRMMLPPVMRGKVVRKVRATASTPDVKLPGGAAGEILQHLFDKGETNLSLIYARFGKARAQRALSQLVRADLASYSADIAEPEGKARFVSLFSIAPGADIDSWLERYSRSRAARARLLVALRERAEPVAAPELADVAKDPARLLRSLVDDGLVSVTRGEVRRVAGELPPEVADLQLTAAQQAALASIQQCVSTKAPQEILLFGVTASGKTEVYLKCISEALGRGQSAVAIMPEIALTVHAVSAYRGRFGSSLAVLHSRLSAGERGDEWRRIERGEAKVVLGARSALFAPVQDLGLIIIDEEHEPALKQDSDPRYHARDVARRMSAVGGFPLVVGSATPSVETFYRARSSFIGLCELPERIDSRPMPSVEVVDMRDFARAGQLSVLSEPLYEELRDNLSRDGQAILFLNRRAYGTFVMCRECGFVASCPHCAVGLKYHSTDRSLRCHHCAWRKPSPATCPECSGVKIASFGVGTQRVEEELIKRLPQARVLRMDRDTTSGKDSLVELISKFRNREADVLVGTQMLAKGFDFPEVLLVGVINADTGLHMPDFRAAERGFQLLTQVAGRAGRGERPGKVLLQTFQPDHYCIRAACTHNYLAFYEEEMQMRAETEWPPFTVVARIVVQAISDTQCEELAASAAETLRSGRTDIEVIGPSPAPISKIRTWHRWHLLLRARKRRQIIEHLERCGAREWDSRIAIDIDPVSLL